MNKYVYVKVDFILGSKFIFLYFNLTRITMPKTKENKIQTKDVTEPQRILWKVTSGQNKAIPVLSSATWWIRWAFLVCSLYCNKKKSENEEMIVDAIV